MASPDTADFGTEVLDCACSVLRCPPLLSQMQVTFEHCCSAEEECFLGHKESPANVTWAILVNGRDDVVGPEVGLLQGVIFTVLCVYHRGRRVTQLRLTGLSYLLQYAMYNPDSDLEERPWKDRCCFWISGGCG